MNNDIDRSLKKILLENEKLEVPENVSAGIDEILEGLQDRDSDKSKIKMNSITIMSRVAKIAIILLIFASVTKNIDAFANVDNMKKIISMTIGKVTQRSSNSIKDFANYKESEADIYKDVIEQSVTDNGITVQLNEVILDEKELIVAYTVKQNREDFSKLYRPECDLYINNKLLKYGSAGGSHIDEDKNTRRYIYSRDIDYDNLEGELDIKIVFGREATFFREDSFWQGNWQFEFTINREKLMSKVKKIKIDKSFSISKDDVITVDNISITPISTTVSYSYKHEGIIKDSENTPQPAFLMYDENGTKIKPMGASLGTRAVGNGYVGEGYLRCIKLDSNVSKVKIVPYIENEDENSTYNKELKKQVIEVEIK